ncbi:hypothetical protein AAG570_002799 [Ranatra chinensis]|uniref:Uncharacterized protein n=1 Tax=Ranatra chinensis TaxID=642074 RepID=A0ABD0YRN6_9HEMI
MFYENKKQVTTETVVLFALVLHATTVASPEPRILNSHRIGMNNDPQSSGQDGDQPKPGRTDESSRHDRLRPRLQVEGNRASEYLLGLAEKVAESGQVMNVAECIEVERGSGGNIRSLLAMPIRNSNYQIIERSWFGVVRKVFSTRIEGATPLRERLPSCGKINFAGPEAEASVLHMVQVWRQQGALMSRWTSRPLASTWDTCPIKLIEF